MTLRPRLALLLILFPLLTRAAPIALPPSAVTDDTFLVAAIQTDKATPDALEAAMKSVLGDKAGEVDGFLAHYKKMHAACTAAGADLVTLVVAVDAQKEPRPILYVHVKPGGDRAAIEKQIREDEGDNNADPMIIDANGDFMVLHKKDAPVPAAGSAARTAAFTDALAPSDKPIAAAVIVPQSMIDEAQKQLASGMPPAMMTLMNEAKSIRLDLSLGDAPKSQVTFQSADAEAAKHVSEALGTLSSLLTAQVATAKNLPPQAQAQMPPGFADMMDGATTLAEAMKKEPTDTRVTLDIDAKALTSVFRMGFTVRAQASVPNKGGL